MSESNVSTKTEREFWAICFTPDTLQGFLDKLKELLKDETGARVVLRASFRDKDGEFPDVSSLLAQPELPDMLHDIQVDGYGRDKYVLLRRIDKALLFVSSKDEVWTHGAAAVLGKYLARVESESQSYVAKNHAIVALIVREKPAAVKMEPVLPNAKPASSDVIWQRRSFWVGVAEVAATFMSSILDRLMRR